MKSAKITIGAAVMSFLISVEGEYVLVTEDEIRRVLKAMGAKGFSVCLNLESALACMQSAPADRVRDTVACDDGVVFEVLKGTEADEESKELKDFT